MAIVINGEQQSSDRPLNMLALASVEGDSTATLVPITGFCYAKLNEISHFKMKINYQTSK